LQRSSSTPVPKRLRASQIATDSKVVCAAAFARLLDGAGRPNCGATVVFIVAGGKGYYLAGAIVRLVAAGWVCSAPQGGWVEQWRRLVHLDA
jgi:hypothetical protein